MIFNLFWTGLCSILGYSAFVAFLILKNYPSAVLGLISGTTDGVTCLLILLKGKGTLSYWYDQNELRKFCRLGIVAATIGLLNLGYHVTIQIMHKTRKALQERSFGNGAVGAPASEVASTSTQNQNLSLASSSTAGININNCTNSMLPVANSEAVCIVWSFILMRSGIVLMYHAIVYQKVEDVRLLPEHNEEISGVEEPKQETNGAISSVLTSS